MAQLEGYVATVLHAPTKVDAALLRGGHLLNVGGYAVGHGEHGYGWRIFAVVEHARVFALAEALVAVGLEAHEALGAAVTVHGHDAQGSGLNSGGHQDLITLYLHVGLEGEFQILRGVLGRDIEALHGG